MRTLEAILRETSQAMIGNDADRLEELAVEASGHQCIARCDRDRVRRAAAVLEAQVRAAAAYLALRSRVCAAQDSYRIGAWVR